MAQMFVAGEWIDSGASYAVTSPYTGAVVDRVPSADEADVEACLRAAVLGASDMARMAPAARAGVLQRAADLLEARVEELAAIITAESGKPLAEARGEASRVPDLLRLCAFEGAQMRGETLPLGAQKGAAGKVGLTLRVPCGVVVAITPFNYPLLLVAHKLGPALAAGNSVILKPAQATPLSALRLTSVLVEAGLPPLALQCVTGRGADVGRTLCGDRRVRKVTFTGSTAVGEAIARAAGIKKLSLELGSNAPLVVMPDADLDEVAGAVSIGGYVNAGQVCISTQRVIVHRAVYEDFLAALVPRVAAISAGDPASPATTLGPLISEKDAQRVEGWIGDAVAAGARVLTGGERDGALHSATVVADVTPGMRLFRDELFGPAVAVTPADSFAEAVALANDTEYGLSAAVFTRDIQQAWRFVHQAAAGIVHVNWTPLWRADLMPYGGVKASGLGREGPRYAIEEMTEIKTVVFHGVEQ